MRIVDFLSKDMVIPELASRNKKDVICELVQRLSQKGVDQDRLLDVLLEREKLGSTGIGDGVAIPHGKLGEIEDLIASFGRSHEGVEFESLDGKPAHLFFLLVAPENTAGVHLKALARISRLFKDGQFRHALMMAKDRDELYHIMQQEDEKYG